MSQKEGRKPPQATRLHDEGWGGRDKRRMNTAEEKNKTIKEIGSESSVRVSPAFSQRRSTGRLRKAGVGVFVDVVEGGGGGGRRRSGADRQAELSGVEWIGSMDRWTESSWLNMRVGTHLGSHSMGSMGC